MKTKIGYFIIASAIVWGAAIIACAFALKGVPEKDSVIQILSGATIFHLIFIWGLIAGILKKEKEKK